MSITIRSFILTIDFRIFSLNSSIVFKSKYKPLLDFLGIRIFNLLYKNFFPIVLSKISFTWICNLLSSKGIPEIAIRDAENTTKGIMAKIGNIR